MSIMLPARIIALTGDMPSLGKGCRQTARHLYHQAIADREKHLTPLAQRPPECAGRAERNTGSK